MFTADLKSLVQAIYPTIIIIIVSKLMSQEDAVYSSAKHHENGYPLGNARLDSPGNGTLSTIQFGTPRIMTTCEDEGYNTKHEIGTRQESWQPSERYVNIRDVA